MTPHPPPGKALTVRRSATAASAGLTAAAAPTLQEALSQQNANSEAQLKYTSALTSAQDKVGIPPLAYIPSDVFGLSSPTSQTSYRLKPTIICHSKINSPAQLSSSRVSE